MVLPYQVIVIPGITETYYAIIIDAIALSAITRPRH
jgi:hypothetical protein